MVNDTDKWHYLTPSGTVYAGDSPPSGSTVLVAPGGTIDDALAERHGIADKLGDDPAVRRDAAGNPVVVRGGRAIAVDVLPGDDADAKAATEAATKEDEARAKADAKAKAKAKADHEAEAADVEAAREKVAAHDARRKAPDKAADEPTGRVVKADDDAKPKAEGKAVRLGGDVEDKAVAPPAAHKAPPKGK